MRIRIQGLNQASEPGTGRCCTCRRLGEAWKSVSPGSTRCCSTKSQLRRSWDFNRSPEAESPPSNLNQEVKIAVQLRNSGSNHDVCPTRERGVGDQFFQIFYVVVRKN